MSLDPFADNRPIYDKSSFPQPEGFEPRSNSPTFKTSTSDASKPVKEEVEKEPFHISPRGFEYVKRYTKLIPKETWIDLPTRKTFNSAGYDFQAPMDIIIYPGAYETIYTGVKAYMLSNEYLAIHIRSSYGIKKHLRVKNIVGIIDSDYYNNPDNEGEIIVVLVNEGVDPIKIPKGEAFVQGIFCNYLTDDTLPRTARTGGIGSTDK